MKEVGTLSLKFIYIFNIKTIEGELEALTLSTEAPRYSALRETSSASAHPRSSALCKALHPGWGCLMPPAAHLCPLLRHPLHSLHPAPRL